MANKIGIGIITFNREKYFKQVYTSLDGCNYDELVIVNDGTPYKFKPKKGHLIQHPKTMGVTSAKNAALNQLLKVDCNHLFLIEDDTLIKDKNVFKEYIHTADITGLHHLNFEQAAPNHHQFDVNYGNGVVVSFWKNPQGAFSYFRGEYLTQIGLFNEGYKNAFEHVDHAYRWVRAGLLPAFWYFPDIANATDFLEPIKGSNDNSTITNKENYQANWNMSAQHFVRTYGHFTNEIPLAHQTQVVAALSNIQKAYGKKDEAIPNNQLTKST